MNNGIHRQEIWCHECEKYVQFNLDMDIDGNHVLECPNCGHEHCRVVKNGRITGDRWDSRNRNTVYATSVTYSINSVYTNTSTISYYVSDLWVGTTTAT